MMVNDLYAPEKGELRLALESGGRAGGRAGGEAVRDRPARHARARTSSSRRRPSPGRYLLKATAVTETGSRTVSRRKVTIGEP